MVSGVGGSGGGRAGGGGVGGGDALDWPVLLHDGQASARSSLRGNITRPRIGWSYHLGLGRVEAVRDNRRTPPVALDLNSDGKSETVRCEYGATRFAVHDGADGRLLWSAATEQPIYEQLFSVADVDADGDPDLCLVTHYRAEVFDGATGARVHRIAWDVGRNYGFNTWLNLDDDPQLECAILSDYTGHVDVLDTAAGGHARLLWSSVYRREADENAPLDFVRGRRDLRYLYRSVCDLDGGRGDPGQRPRPRPRRAEMVYMVFNQGDRREWRTLIRALPGGETIADLEHHYIYGVQDVDDDGAPELLAAELRTYGTRGFAPLSVWKVRDGKPERIGGLGAGRFVLADDPLPPHAAANGQKTAERCTVATTDFDGNGRAEILLERDGNGDGVADAYEALERGADGRFAAVNTVLDPDQSYVFETIVKSDVLEGYDVNSGDALTFRAGGLVERRKSPRGWSFFSDAVAGDIDGDGTCEIVVQRTNGWIEVLRDRRPDQPAVAWKRRGWGMNRHAGYTLPTRGVLLRDLDGDGKAEVIFAGISADAAGAGGAAALVIADHQGKTVWQRALPGVTPDWTDSGIDQWSVGRLNGDAVADVVVQYHDLGHSSAKLLALDGRDGKPLWAATQTSLAGLPRPMSSANLLMADFNRDGRDDVGLMPSNGFVALSGADGSPLLSVRFYPPDPAKPAEWKPKDSDAPYGTLITAHDADGDAAAEVFFSDRLTQAALRCRPSVEKMWLVGEAHPGEVANQFRAEDNPLLADVNDDGKLEFCAFHRNGRLVIHDARTGGVTGEFRLPATPTSEAVAADIDGDGRTDLLFGAGMKLVAVTIDPGPPGAAAAAAAARELWSVEFKERVGAPAIADVDRDGHADVLVPTGDAHLHCVTGP